MSTGNYTKYRNPLHWTAKDLEDYFAQLDMFELKSRKSEIIVGDPTWAYDNYNQPLGLTPDEHWWLGK